MAPPKDRFKAQLLVAQDKADKAVHEASSYKAELKELQKDMANLTKENNRLKTAVDKGQTELNKAQGEIQGMKSTMSMSGGTVPSASPSERSEKSSAPPPTTQLDAQTISGLITSGVAAALAAQQQPQQPQLQMLQQQPQHQQSPVIHMMPQPHGFGGGGFRY